MARMAAELLIDDLNGSIATVGSATWVAAGGTTPALAYQILAGSGSRVDWTRVRVVMGDERFVPLDDPDSNWGLLTRKLLQAVPVRSENLAVPDTSGSLGSATTHYAARLAALASALDGTTRITHTWIGMGEDGHTLSLFPDHPSSAPTDELVIAVDTSPKPPPQRISLTQSAVKSSGHLVVLACGGGKRDVIKRVFDGAEDLPVASVARAVERAGGKVSFLVDRAAASRL